MLQFLHRLKKFKERKSGVWAKAVFIILGVLSTIWFLFRVIPKPSRAGYPCVKATAPIMSSFVLWIIGAGTSVFLVRKSRDFLAKNKYAIAV